MGRVGESRGAAVSISLPGGKSNGPTNEIIDFSNDTQGPRIRHISPLKCISHAKYSLLCDVIRYRLCCDMI